MEAFLSSVHVYVWYLPMALSAAAGLAMAICLWRKNARVARPVLFGSMLLLACFVLIPLPVALDVSMGLPEYASVCQFALFLLQAVGFMAALFGLYRGVIRRA